MTAAHPLAVGTYGPVFVSWSEERTGQELYWWQKLTAYRALEHDEAGALLWGEVLLTTSRQVGKSHLLRELILWRLEQGLELFGNAEETITYTANHLDLSREVIRPALSWADGQPGWTVRRANGETRAEHPNGSRWLVKATRSAGYGFTLTVALVDEAWDVEPLVVDDQLSPTLMTTESAQLWLVSTANEDATDLMPTRRTVALAQLHQPQATLLIEWSGDPALAVDDLDGWRQASPRWNDRRQAFLASQFQKVSEAAFRAQWLSQWPGKATRLRLIDEESWAELADAKLTIPPGAQLTMSLDAIGGGGFAVVVGWPHLEGVGLAPRSFPSRLAALTYVTDLCAAHPGSRLMLGASLEALIDPMAFPGELGLAGIRETRQATHLFQGLASEGKIRHPADPALSQQVVYAVVVKTDVGPVLSGTRSPGPVDLARGAVWVAWSVTTRAAQSPGIW
jgi:hypothetical protein